MRPTWTLLPDSKDVPNPPRNLAAEQATELKGKVPKLWDALSKRQQREERVKSKFRVGDRVIWTSQSQGFTTTKTGIIVAVVPGGVDPIKVVPAGMKIMPLHGVARNYESYLVQVGGSKTLYWPLVKNLKLC